MGRRARLSPGAVRRGERPPALHALLHPTRYSIFGQVLAWPGIRTADFVESCGDGEKTLRYHLEYLVKDALIQRGPGRRFEVAPDGHVMVKRLRLLQSDVAQSVLAQLWRTNRGKTLAQLASTAGVEQLTVLGCLKGLADAGLILAWFGGKSVYARCTAEGRQYCALLDHRRWRSILILNAGTKGRELVQRRMPRALGLRSRPHGTAPV
jgi:hypothetical protein